MTTREALTAKNSRGSSINLRTPSFEYVKPWPYGLHFLIPSPCPGVRLAVAARAGGPAWSRRLFGFPEPGCWLPAVLPNRHPSIAFATAAAQAVARSLRLRAGSVLGFFFLLLPPSAVPSLWPCCCSLGWTQHHSPRAAAPHASSRALHPAPARIRCPCPVLTHCTHTLLCHTRPPTATRLILAPSRQVSAVRLCIFIPSFPFDWHVLLSNYVVANRRSQRVFIEADGCDSPVLVAVTTFPPSLHHTSRPP